MKNNKQLNTNDLRRLCLRFSEVQSKEMVAYAPISSLKGIQQTFIQTVVAAFRSKRNLTDEQGADLLTETYDHLLVQLLKDPDCDREESIARYCARRDLSPYRAFLDEQGIFLPDGRVDIPRYLREKTALVEAYKPYAAEEGTRVYQAIPQEVAFFDTALEVDSLNAARDALSATYKRYVNSKAFETLQHKQ